MNITRLDIELTKYNVGLSGAIPDRKDWSEAAMDRAILEFVALLSGIVFKYGGRIVHGCHPTFTPIILRQARLHASLRVHKPVTLVMSELWAKDLEKSDIEAMTDIAEFIITPKVGDGGVENITTRNDSLSLMRRTLIDEQNVMVAVGGKMHGEDGVVPGVAEEMAMAAEVAIPRFLVGGMGGYAQSLAGKLTPSSLNNGLSRDEDILLFGSNDVSASVNLIFQKLSSHSLKIKNAPVKRLKI
ncbi:hypothetical protein [Janthinobacterium tructae]